MHLEKDRISDIIKSFAGKKILVVGDVMVDEYLKGDVSRISPEAPVPIVEIEEHFIRFGGAANVALNIKELGCIPILTGVIGKDTLGKSFLDLMDTEQMDSSYLIETNKRPTTSKTRIIGDDQHITRVDRESRTYVDGKIEESVLKTIVSALNVADAVILEDYNKGVLTKKIINSTILAAREKNIPVAVDPKFINFLEFKNATFFKPNIKEAEQAIAKTFDDLASLEKYGLQILERLEAESLLLTRGSSGASLFEKNKKITHIPTLARKVADVSGAGDTVIATLTAAYIGGASKVEAAILANKAAGIVVEEVGIVPVKKDKLLL